MCRSDSLMSDQRIFKLSMYCTLTMHGDVVVLISLDVVLHIMTRSLRSRSLLRSTSWKPNHFIVNRLRVTHRSRKWKEQICRTKWGKRWRPNIQRNTLNSLFSDLFFHRLMAKVQNPRGLSMASRLSVPHPGRRSQDGRKVLAHLSMVSDVFGVFRTSVCPWVLDYTMAGPLRHQWTFRWERGVGILYNFVIFFA